MMRKVGGVWVCTIKRHGMAPITAMASERHIAWQAAIDAAAECAR